MKVTITHIDHGQDEAEIRCHEVSKEVESIIRYIENSHKKLVGYIDKQQFGIDPQEVLYLESVDNITFIYTCDKVYRSTYTLSQLEPLFSEHGYFRCSKSMILNIYRINSLKSEAGNRIDATMENGEHVMISRRYSKELRLILKGEQE